MGYGQPVTVEFLIRHWSLLLASVLFTAIALFVLFRVFTDSARGQLGARVRALSGRYRDVDSARSAVARAERKLGALEKKAARVKPRHLEESREALADARALLKIASDQVLIAENHVRKIIVEEYPPERQESLRERYLRPTDGQEKPFSF